MRSDANLSESRRHRIDPGNRAQQFVIRTRAPGVTVGTGRTILFSPGGKSVGQHATPRGKLFQIAVTEPGMSQSGIRVRPEINRRPGDLVIRENLFENSPLILFRHRS